MNEPDFTWLSDHSPELFREYAGKWIAVHDGRVVGVGDTATEVAAQADQSCPDGNYILQVMDAVGDVIYSTP